MLEGELTGEVGNDRLRLLNVYAPPAYPAGSEG
jgi:hypothetical protein